LDRLRAARALVREGTNEDYEVVTTAYDLEGDALVKDVLGRVLRGLGNREIPEPNRVPIVSMDEELSDVYAQAVDDVTVTFLHELRPLWGTLDSRAHREVPGYEETRTYRAASRIKSFLDAMQKLRDASQVPVIVDFDLSDFVRDAVEGEEFTDCRVFFAREDPVPVWGDPDLLRLAFLNAVRNACESAEQAARPDGRVVINWGATDSDAWIAVLDDGLGLPEASHRVWEAGLTLKSKDQHDGFGLTIAQRAMTSLDGLITLLPRDEGGAACEIRWAAQLQA
jgi:signal transduction histidine kinase